MYLFELQDILFAIKSIKVQTKQFNIYNYINFSSATTRSDTSNKMIIPHHLNKGVSIHWTVLLDWNTGLDWTTVLAYFWFLHIPRSYFWLYTF